METTKQILKSLTLLYAEDNDQIRETTLRTYYYINKILIKDDTLEIHLSKKEIALIEYLLNKRSTLSTQDELMSEIFIEDTDLNNLRNVIYRLKKKVDLNFIVTVKDLGYMIV